MNKFLPFFCGLMAMYACQPVGDSAQEESPIVIDEAARQRIDSTLQAFIDDSLVAGASALIVEKGKEVYFNALGHADREAGVPMRRNTMVSIYSMTKPLTGTTLMSLYEEGAFELEDPLAQHAPIFADMQVATALDESGEFILAPTARPITVADITRHTAGFSRRADLGLDKVVGEADLLNMESTLTDMATKLSTIPLGYQPGTRWEYGISVDVQAYLVEQLTGKPFHESMRERVLDPLGMDDTGYFVPKEKRERVAAIYRKTENGLRRIPDEEVHTRNYADWPMKPGGWGLKSTLDDYMTFAQMLLHEGTYKGTTVLQPQTVQRMATNHLPAVEDSSWLVTKGRVGFGIDFAVRVAPPQRPDEMNGVAGEFYWDGAATTLFWVDPKNQMTVVLFVQVMPFQARVHKDFRDAVYGPIDG